MNERIKQLCEQAKEYANEHTQDFTGNEPVVWMDYYTEKFAELLIKETRLKAIEEVRRATAQRDSLLEVLKEVEPFLVVLHGPSWALAARKRVRLAIKAVEGGV